MTFFNPFRKNAQKPEERREPSGDFKRDGAVSSTPASDEPVLDDEAPAPWDPVNPEEPFSADRSGSEAPPAFEEVPHPATSANGDSPETYDPYGIAAQEKALRERDEAMKQAEEILSAQEGAAMPPLVEPVPVARQDAEEPLEKAPVLEPIEAARIEEAPQEVRADAPFSAERNAEKTAAAIAPAEEAVESTSEGRQNQKKPRRSYVSAEPDWPRRELTDEEILARRRTKHRLVGAAALLLAVVVAAPFILDSEGDFDSSSISTDIPIVSEMSTTLEVPPVPPAEFTGNASTEKFSGSSKPDMPKEIAKTVQDQEAEEKPAAKPAEKTTEETADKKDAKPAAKADAKSDAKGDQKTEQKRTKTDTVGIEPPEGQGYYVQVIATSSELEAERTVKKLALMGLPAYRVPVQTRAATLWRVRVGLYKTRKEADGIMGTIVLNGVASKPMVGSQ